MTGARDDLGWGEYIFPLDPGDPSDPAGDGGPSMVSEGVLAARTELGLGPGRRGAPLSARRRAGLEEDAEWPALPPTVLAVLAVDPAKGPRDWYAGDPDITAGAWLSHEALRCRRRDDRKNAERRDASLGCPVAQPAGPLTNDSTDDRQGE